MCCSSLCVAVGGEGLGSVVCFDTPELSASMMVDSSAESGGPGEGVRRVNALRSILKTFEPQMNVKKTYQKATRHLWEGSLRILVYLEVVYRELKEREIS